MINSNKNIYIQEREVKPNKYTLVVLTITLCCVFVSWIATELGFFRVDKTVMRIGTLLSVFPIALPLVTVLINKRSLENPKVKYVIMCAAIVFTLTTTTLIAFHTTIMILFPIFIAMLYRSKKLGKIALIASIAATFISVIGSYLLGIWDIPLFQELILIGTGGTAEIVNPDYTIKWIDIGKIILYLVFPRLLMVGSCGTLLFYIIGIGEDYVNNQILLNEISHNDALTGLFNQNYFKEVCNSNELKGQIAAIFFDINGLKISNDSKGHEYGDSIIKACGQSIKNVLEENRDYGFRVGGDEFVILSEFVTERYVEDKIIEWRKSLEEINIEVAKNLNGYQCSMAVGYTIGDARYINDLVKEADAYMYQNKAKEKAEQLN